MTSFLRQRRTALQLSQGNLADMLGVSQQTVARWENSGQVPAKYIKDLAVVMGARAEDFLPRAEESPARRSATTLDQGDRSAEDDDAEEATTPFGDVRLHFSDHAGSRTVSYPVTWGMLNHIQEQLGDVGVGFARTAPWIQFETLNNKWVAVNTHALDRATFVNDDVEEMTFYTHEEVYKAARALWDCMPTDDEMESEDFAYSRQLVGKVENLIGRFSREARIELEGVAVDLTSGERFAGRLNPEVALSLDAMFSSRMEEDLLPNRFLQLTFRDTGTYEHVRLGAVILIEAALLAFDEACQSEASGL